MSENNCLGCNLANKVQPVHLVYEDNYVTCFLDHDPFNDGHTLILPKQHFVDVDELCSETANAIMSASILISKAIKLLFNPDGITICQNGGVFNELTHYHLHVVPRYQNQSFAEFYMDGEVTPTEKAHLSDTKSRMSEAINSLLIWES